MPEHSSPAASEWRLGWRPLVAAFVGTGVSWNLTGVIAGLFLKSMQADFGWSRTELTFGPLAGIVVALILPFTSLVLDRFGARRTAITGTVALAGAYLALSLMPQSRPVYYAVLVFLSLAASICNSVIFSRGLTDWFDKRLGTAIGIMITGGAVSGALVTPALAFCIEQYGWRAGFMALAFGTVTIGLAFLIPWFKTRESDQSAGDEAMRPSPFGEIFSRSAFWLLALGIFLPAISVGGFLQHLVPLITDNGIPLSVAVGLGSVLALSIGVGSIAVGVLMDRFNPYVICAVTFLLAAGSAGVILTSAEAGASSLLLGAAIAFIGAAAGTEGDAISVFSIRLFGLATYARVATILAMVVIAGMSAGGLLFASAFDVTGSYALAIEASIACFAVSAALFLMLRKQPVNS